MMISTKDWLAYINKLSMLDKTAADKMQAYVAKHGFGDTAALIDYAYAITTKYGEGSAALAAEMYDTIAELAGKNLPPAEMAPTPEYDEVAKAVNGTAKYRNVELVSNAVGRLVKRTGVDTTMRNAIRDGAQWAWIPHGDTCAFCLTLASRGWQPASEKALKGGHAEHIHAHCDCTYAISFDGKPKYASYNSDKYLEMYENAEGSSSQDKINSLRRQKYQQNKDKINAQKREAYKLKKARDRNHAKITELISNNGDTNTYNPSEIVERVAKSKVGKDSIKYIEENNIKVFFDNISYGNGCRGGSDYGYIKLYTKNISNDMVAQQTLVHEATHLRYDIGDCQHAEAICFSYEKMHKENRDYLTRKEWDDMVELAKKTYPEYNWEIGGRGDYGQFNFVRE